MEEIEEVEVEEESVEEPTTDEELSDELIEEEPLEEEVESGPVYAEEVKEMAFSRRSEISDLSKKLKKYVDTTQAAIDAKQLEIKMLLRVAKTLPERPEMSPDLPFGVSPAEPAHVSVSDEVTEEVNLGESFYSQDGKLIKGTPPRSPAPDDFVDGEVDTLEAAGVLPIEDEDPETEGE